MKTTSYHILLCLLLLPSWLNAQQGEPVTVGTTYSLYSEVLEEERRYSVYLPPFYERPPDLPEQQYPVMYLLDGEVFFRSVSGLVDYMSSSLDGRFQIPQLIVVAVHNTNRMRDMTPSNSDTGADGSRIPFFGEVSGGGDDFLRFLEEELMPEIEGRYRTLPFRVLVGHSVAGLLGLHALVQRPDLFQATIAIDPSLWWDDRTALKAAQERLADANDLRHLAYVASANNLPLPGTEGDVMRETAEAFNTVMEQALASQWRFYEEEDHGTLPLIATYDGLRFIFEGYKPLMNGLVERRETLVEDFEGFSERMGVRLLPPELDLVDAGMDILEQGGDSQVALDLLTAAERMYPESAYVQRSLGEAYLELDEQERARAHFQRSLELQPQQPNVEQVLEGLP